MCTPSERYNDKSYGTYPIKVSNMSHEIKITISFLQITLYRRSWNYKIIDKYREAAGPNLKISNGERSHYPRCLQEECVHTKRDYFY